MCGPSTRAKDVDVCLHSVEKVMGDELIAEHVNVNSKQWTSLQDFHFKASQSVRSFFGILLFIFMKGKKQTSTTIFALLTLPLNDLFL